VTDQPSLVPTPVDAGERAPIPPTPNGCRPPTAVSLSAPGAGNDAAVFADLSVLHLDRSERRITVCGQIDFAAVPLLADAMHQLIDLDPGDSTIDLAGVSFIAAAGLGCLVGFANQLANSDAKITVVGASDRLRRLFDIVQLGGLLKSS
jgi:anti-sigma B factor antagonist